MTLTSITCPKCHGKGFLRTGPGGEAEDCPLCEGQQTLYGYACESPEQEWIRDLKEAE